ncbi:MAG: TatD family hydrolase [Pseudomonadota bacterium]
MAVDSHCHLDYEQFDADRAEVMQRAREAGIDYMMTIGVELSKMPGVVAIAEGSDRIFATAGIHPHEADHAPEDTAQQLRELVGHPKIVGIGETGLDYYYGHSERDKQIKSFQTHIEVAQESGLPIIVHTRDAEEDTITIIRDMMAQKPFPFLIHCFSGTQYLAEESLKLGGYISISGIVTFKKAEELREVVKTIPNARLMVETDAPYLAPMPHRGKRNEPAFTRLTLEKVAEIKQIDVSEMDRITTQNYFDLFTKAKHLTLQT